MDVVFATAGYDYQVRLWNIHSQTVKYSIPTPDMHVNCLEISFDKKYLAVGSNPKCFVYDLETKSNEPVFKLEGHTNNITSVHWQKDGRWLFTTSEDGTAKVWDPRSGRAERSLMCYGPVNCGAIHPNQGEVITGDGRGHVMVWDLASSTILEDMQPERDVAIQGVDIAFDASLLVAATFSGQCFVWSGPGPDTDRPEYAPVKQFRAHKSTILRARLSPNGKYFATCSADCTVKVWSTSDWNCAHTLQGHSRWVWDCRFSVDGKCLTTASSDCQAKLWDLRSDSKAATFSGHSKSIIAMALNDIAPESSAPAAGTAAAAGTPAT